MIRSCRHCGCTDERACAGGCCWVVERVCSSVRCVLAEHERLTKHRARSYAAAMKVVLECQPKALQIVRT